MAVDSSPAADSERRVLTKTGEDELSIAADTIISISELDFDQPHDRERHQPGYSVHVTSKVVDDAELLLKYAAETGLQLKPELIAAIEAAGEARGRNNWTAEIAEDFWSAYSDLSNAVKPATAESYRACSGSHLGRTTRRYRRPALCLMALILPLSVLMFINTSISNEIGDRIKDNDALLLKLREHLFGLSSRPGEAD